MTDNRPYDALGLRDWLQCQVLLRRAAMTGDCTLGQARAVAIYMGTVCGNTKVGKKDRLSVLSYLVGRVITSAKDLTSAEASVLLSWLSETTPAVLRIETRAILVEVLIQQGHIGLVPKTSLD